MASGSGKARATSWAAAMGVGTVEALKDQAGLCRWNYAFRQAQQRASRRPAGASGSSSGGPGTVGGSSAAEAARRKAKQQEEELRTVMYLSTWGPNN